MYNIKRLEEHIIGLKFRPSIEPEHSDAVDFYGEFHRGVEQEFSADNQTVLKEYFLRLPSARCVVEIGVQRNPLPESSTGILLVSKQPDAVYIGVDIEDKSHLHDPNRNVYLIKGDSADRQRVYDLMQDLGLAEIDFLFIDGWHSVNQCLEDWKYVERLALNGTVVMHDTNVHPGPVAIFEAVDEGLFDKQKHCTEGADWGIGTLIRRQQVIRNSH